jgi:hypothetical protein
VRKGNTTDCTHTYGYDLLALLKGEPMSLLFCKAPRCYDRIVNREVLEAALPFGA